MTSKNIAILNTSSPYSSTNAKDALDLAMIFGAYEQNINLFFQGEGIWQLIDGQSPELVNTKDFLKTMSAFEFYDIENIYACSQSLSERGLDAGFHIDNVIVLSPEAFSEKLKLNNVIFKL
ncbi:sulfurtransferase complex subunit TusC [Colwelliaceae bacterium 6471]